MLSMHGDGGRWKENIEKASGVKEVKKTYLAECGGQLILPLSPVETLNPLISENKSYHHFSKLIFEGLFELDNELNIENLLAKDYTMDEDGKISIQLRDDVYWHDGERFTAEDVTLP